MGNQETQHLGNAAQPWETQIMPQLMEQTRRFHKVHGLFGWDHMEPSGGADTSLGLRARAPGLGSYGEAARAAEA